MNGSNLTEIRIMSDVKCPMRDGIKLATDVYLPTKGGPFPTILWRTPYDKRDDAYVLPNAIYFAQHGYAVAVQDVRGRYASEGKWYPYLNEVTDGYDAVEWAAGQKWSNGKVGMSGNSYHGFTQIQAAQSGCRHLAAIVPRDAFDNPYNKVYVGGAYQFAFDLEWSILMNGRINQFTPKWYPDEIGLNRMFHHLPLITADEQIGKVIPHWKDWIQNPSYGEYWKKLRPAQEHYAEIATPAFHMAGWYDAFLNAGLNNFLGISQFGRTEEARQGQKIIIGPWVHGQGSSGTEQTTGDINFGQNVLVDLKKQELRWHEYWLKGIDDGIMEEPRIRLFVMGANCWREADQWPLPETIFAPYYLRSKGNANSLFGDGSLSIVHPENEPPDTYLYDPDNPVMTVGGSACCSEDTMPVTMGPRDQRSNEHRPDVLVYTTAPLIQDTEVTGPINAIIYASSTAKDTDFCAKLVDVYPCGFAMNVAQGVIRARYRDSLETQQLMEPGTIYRFEIDLWATSNCFRKGHAIRLEITSSNFPQYNRNPNTGAPFGMDTYMITAQQTIYHHGDCASHIILPVIPSM